MKKRIVVSAVLVLLVTAPTVQAGGKLAGVPTVRTAVIDPRSGLAIPAVTKLHPVIGSVQRTSHITNPFTHKAKYSSVNYNPILGTFGTQKFKQ